MSEEAVSPKSGATDLLELKQDVYFQKNIEGKTDKWVDFQPKVLLTNVDAPTTITSGVALKNVQLNDENEALKSQLNTLLKDNAELWEQKLELSQQVVQLYTDNTNLNNLLDELKTDFQQTTEAKDALEKRSSAETQLILKAETDTLITDLSRCRIQKSALTDQLSTALQELSNVGTEISKVKEKNFNLLQQLSIITSPSPLQVVKSLVYDHENTQPYFLVHQFRRLKQKKQLLEAAIEMSHPMVLRDIVITLHMGLADHAFADLIAPYPEAIDIFVSHMMGLGPTAWGVLIPLLGRLGLVYEEGMLRLRLSLMEADPLARRALLQRTALFFASSDHIDLHWTLPLLDNSFAERLRTL